MNEAIKRRSGSRKRTVKSAGREARSVSRGKWVNEALAITALAASFFFLVSFLSFEFARLPMTMLGESSARSARNLMGPVGHFLGTLLAGFFGWCGLVPVLYLAWLSRHLWRCNDDEPLFKPGSRVLMAAGLLGSLVFSSMLLAIFSSVRGGGTLGIFLSGPLVRLFSPIGGTLFAAAFLLASMALLTQRSVAEILVSSVKGAGNLLRFTLVTLPAMTARAATVAWSVLSQGFSVLAHALFARKMPRPANSEPVLPPPRVRRNSLRQANQDETAPEPAIDEDNERPAGEPAFVVVQRKSDDSRVSERELKKLWKRRDGVTTVTEDNPYAGYSQPPVAILTKGEVLPGSEDDAELRDISRQIETKLKDFGIFGRVTHIHPGPVITLFEYEPAAGVKVGRIAALQDDLAMGLRASSIRIIAPIPKRGTVGIEVPNRHRDIVRLRDVLESKSFVDAESILSVAMGKDTYGEPVVVDISTMPHLLMAGATGTGKSVCINALLLSLLYRASPADLGLILIDPKILELSVYEDIPHLRVPVVTVPRQAKAVLEWAINEMNRRYRVMQKLAVRNIDSYNKIVSGELDKDGAPREKPAEPEGVVQLKEDEVIEPGTVDSPVADAAPLPEAEGAEGELEFTEQLKPLPKIVIVIDELADLMLSVGRDIEELITRLAQKARAAGIHLIVATQRPSVDVITGLIKANFPARLSFRVSSRIDSRTILDQMGADKLLGRGDMLFMQPGAEPIRRIHGAFVSDTEVKRVVAAIKEKCKPHYDERIMALCEKALEEEAQQGAEGGPTGPTEYDEMYDKCVELVMQKGQASTSMLQRAFRLGYNRAARIVDMMEREGIIGPMDGAKPREVLIPQSENS